MDYKRICMAGIFCTCMTGALKAQENEFDLTAQRSELQNVLAVPGHKMEHHGIIINPTPQKLEIAKSGKLDISKGVVFNDKKKKFASDVNFLSIKKKDGVKLNIDFGAKLAANNGIKAVSGAYSLNIDKKGVNIIGYDERGAFYGLQTLRQLIESPATNGNILPYLSINDYPSLPSRGVVEGFYGEPWSHAVRMSLIDFYGKFKLNTYLYGPKDDPYHSSPNWRLPYPEQEAKNIKELVDACRRNRVDFVWAIHPGKDIKWNEEDYRNLIHKFNLMYDLGVRDYAVFFDDIEGEGTNPLKQTELLNRLNDEFSKEKGDVGSLTVCPTDYSRLWANPTPQGSLAIYGNTLNKDIKVFWTGDFVCSDMTRETLDWVNSRIQRPAYYWWNYPVTDYVRHIVLQGPVYGLDTTLTAKETSGLISNPMEHGEASKLALYGVADYAWNVSAYNAIDNWERGLGELVPEAREAYRTFAIHSSDTENGYRRAESWETNTFRLANWTDESAQLLKEEFQKVADAHGELEKKCGNKALMNELRPWLTEFEKLGNRGLKALQLAELYRSKNSDDAEFWNKYVGNIMTKEECKAYEAHKSGTMKLQPFYENIMDDMSFGFYNKLTGKIAKDYKGIGSFNNSNTIQTKLMLDNDSTTFYTSGMSQRTNDWIGVDLRTVCSVKEMDIRQGRNSVDDVDYFDHVRLEYSADGKNWTTLLDDLSKQYIIAWKGKAVDARYVRLKRLDSEKKNYASVRTFKVNPLTVENVGFKIESANNDEALRAFDGNLNTSFIMKNGMSFDVEKGTKEYIILMKQHAEKVIVKQYDAKGKLLSEMPVATSFAKTDIAHGAVKMKIEGNVEVVEVIAK